MTRARSPRPADIAAAARDPRYRRALDADSDGPWRTEGLCRDQDAEIWFPATVGNADEDLALAWCALCPVQGSCLRMALEGGDDQGVFGATTARQRRSMLAAFRRRVGVQR